MQCYYKCIWFHIARVRCLRIVGASGTLCWLIWFLMYMVGFVVLENNWEILKRAHVTIFWLEETIWIAELIEVPFSDTVLLVFKPKHAEARKYKRVYYTSNKREQRVFHLISISPRYFYFCKRITGTKVTMLLKTFFFLEGKIKEDQRWENIC